MAHFDQEKAYAEQEEVFFDDGREIELLHFVYGRPNLSEIRGSPKRVLEAVDDYGRTKKYLMNVGEDKGKIVADLISKTQPKTMVSTLSYSLYPLHASTDRSQVELGGYVGYSCILFGEALRKAGGKQYFSLERNPEFAAVIGSLVDLAGLSDMVKVIVGPSDASLKRLYAEGHLSHIDLMFLDHYKPAYLPDLKLCEQLGLIGPGSVLAADNVIKPGNPPYLEYVRASAEEKSNKDGEHGLADGTRGFQDRTAKQYAKREGEEQLNLEIRGDPRLVYESELVESFEPTGDTVYPF